MVAPAVATAVYAKEIAFELDFPNLSFFGKYFKARKGVSPRLYRTAWLHTQGTTCKQLTPLNRKGWGRQRREWGNRLSVSCVRMRYRMVGPDCSPAHAVTSCAGEQKQGRTL